MQIGHTVNQFTGGPAQFVRLLRLLLLEVARIAATIARLIRRRCRADGRMWPSVAAGRNSGGISLFRQRGCGGGNAARCAGRFAATFILVVIVAGLPLLLRRPAIRRLLMVIAAIPLVLLVLLQQLLLEEVALVVVLFRLPGGAVAAQGPAHRWRRHGRLADQRCIQLRATARQRAGR